MYENGTVGLGYRCIGDNTTYYFSTPPYIGEKLSEEKYKQYIWYKKCENGNIISYDEYGTRCVSDEYWNESSTCVYKNITFYKDGKTYRMCYRFSEEASWIME